jgi:raffinose/stachyose/melibiose transport system substrate-binding protein
MKYRKVRDIMMVGAIAAALVVPPMSATAAPAPKAGAACSKLNATSGVGLNALVCVKNTKKNAKVKLVWKTTYIAVKAYKAPAGSIEFWHWRGEDKAVFDSIIAKFQAANPGVTITQVITNTGDYQATSFAKIRRNSKAALFGTLRGPNFLQFAPTGLMADLSNEKFLSNVNPNGLLAGQYKGKQVAVSIQYLFNNPVYNTEIMAQAGITKLPTNFTGFLGMCRTLKSKGFVPMAWPGATLGQAGQILNSMMMNQFTSYEQMEKSVAQIETGVKDLTVGWFADMANKYAQMRDAGCFPDNPTGVTEATANNLFATGKAAIMPTGTFSMGAIKAINPAMEGKMKLMSLIGTDGKVYYEGIHNNTFNLSVNDNASDNDQAIARAFISFMLQPEIASEYANGTTQHVNVSGVTYTNKDLINTSDFQKKKTLLAPRFLFTNQGIRDLLEQSLIAIVGGKDVKTSLEDSSKLIAEKIG